MQQKQVVVLTGTSRGIGRQLLTLFLEKTDLTVISLSRTKPNNIEQTSRFLHLNFNLANNADFGHLEAFLQKNGIRKVDFLVNNAGLLYHADFIGFAPDKAREIFEINFFGAAKLIQTLHVFLKTSENAHVVNIGSMGGFQGSAKFAGLSYYSASKAALANLTEVLSEEFKNEHISINTLSLGAVETEMLYEAFPEYHAPVSAAEMAGFILDFTLTGHRFFNGKNLPVAISTP